jgi:hypothetical protein
MQGIHKKNGSISKVIKTIFLTLHGHNLNYQKLELFEFLMRYEQFAS